MLFSQYRSNRITTDGAVVIAKALPANESLTVLKVNTILTLIIKFNCFNLYR